MNKQRRTEDGGFEIYIHIIPDNVWEWRQAEVVVADENCLLDSGHSAPMMPEIIPILHDNECIYESLSDDEITIVRKQR